MKTFALLLMSGAMLASFQAGSASAAPLAVHRAVHESGPAAEPVGYHRGRYYHARDHHRAWRRHHTRNRLRHGDPNARNPSLPGYAQQRGSTSGGPRY